MPYCTNIAIKSQEISFGDVVRKYFVVLLFLSLCIETRSSEVFQKEVYQLGQSLFFDKILSGNKNISCATCHNPLTGTSDSLSLGIGEGGIGLGLNRSDPHNKIWGRVPRNSPVLWNVGHISKKVYFHDGRVELDYRDRSKFSTPVGDQLPAGLKDLLAAQALFPITSPIEMAGNDGENDIAIQAERNNLAGTNGVWALIEKRLQDIPEYVEAFKNAYPKEIKQKSDITIIHYANATSQFQKEAFKSLESPYDKFINGREDVLSEQQKRGFILFKGKARCFECHNGPLLTDEKFHSLGFPQIGPGKGDGLEGFEDYGRFRETKNPKDKYRFLTPTLRNIALSPPFGHAGTFESLEDVVKAHFMADGGHSLMVRENLRVPTLNEDISSIDFLCLDDYFIRAQIISSRDSRVPELNQKEVDDIVSFLHTLTDQSALDRSTLIPKRVFSGLPIFN